MKLLALDLALRRTGWACVEGTPAQMTLLARGVIQTKGARDAALYDLSGQVGTLLRSHLPLDSVYVEVPGRMNNVRGRKTDTVVALAQALGVVLAVAAGLGIPAHEVQQSTVKAWLAGYRYASKESVAQVVSYYAQAGTLQGYTVPLRPRGSVDSDINDAIALGLVGMGMAGRSDPHTLIKKANRVRSARAS